MKQRQKLQLIAIPTIIILVVAAPVLVFLKPDLISKLFWACFALPLVYLVAHAYFFGGSSVKTNSPQANWPQTLGLISIIILIQLWLGIGFISQTLLIIKLSLNNHYFHDFVTTTLQQYTTHPLIKLLPLFPGLFMGVILLLIKQAKLYFPQKADFLSPITQRQESTIPKPQTRIIRRFLQMNHLMFLAIALVFISITIIWLILPNNQIWSYPSFTYLLVGLFIITTQLPDLRARLHHFHQRRQPLLLLGSLLILLVINAVLVHLLTQYIYTQPFTGELITKNYEFIAGLQSPQTLNIWFYGWWLCAMVLPLSYVTHYTIKHKTLSILIATVILPSIVTLLSLWLSPSNWSVWHNPQQIDNLIITGQALFAIGWSIFLVAPRSHAANLWFGYFAKPTPKTRAIPAKQLSFIIALIWFLQGIFGLTSLSLIGILGTLNIYTFCVLAYKLFHKPNKQTDMPKTGTN